MKLLVVGGAGLVGSVIRPSLAEEFECTYFDVRPIPNPGPNDIVGDVNDDATVQRAVQGQQAVVYLAMGIRPGTAKDVSDIDQAFNVNVRGWYRVLFHGQQCGIRRYVYASTLSVYNPLRSMPFIDESIPPTAFDPYGLSKRLGEQIGAAAVQKHPDTVIVAVRMCLPQRDEDWARLRSLPPEQRGYAQGPNDLRRLYLAALRLDKPGMHVVQTTGDIEGRQMPNTRAGQLLGWQPRDE